VSAAAAWKREGTGEDALDRRRARLGAQLRLHPDLKVQASAAAEPLQRRWGFAAEASYTPTDHLVFSLRGDSSTWSLPAGALREGHAGPELETSALYRHSELLEIETRLRGLWLDDGNRILAGAVEGRLQLHGSGHWRVMLGAETEADGSSLAQDRYFSPSLQWVAVAAPAVEHVWRRTRRYGLQDRLSLRIGLGYEAGFGVAERLRLDYEQSHAFGDVAELLLQSGLSRRHWGGVPELGWRLGLGSRVRF
jgi:hypothetical protein